VVILVSTDKKRVMVTLSKEVADNLDEIAKNMGLSKSALITLWVNENRKESEQKK
jgi:metal-responsive CopG/Arc/MetJ family transcriptional regulator